jgi:hypothetical protein
MTARPRQPERPAPNGECGGLFGFEARLVLGDQDASGEHPSGLTGRIGISPRIVLRRLLKKSLDSSPADLPASAMRFVMASGATPSRASGRYRRWRIPGLLRSARKDGQGLAAAYQRIF